MDEGGEDYLMRNRLFTATACGSTIVMAALIALFVRGIFIHDEFYYLQPMGRWAFDFECSRGKLNCCTFEFDPAAVKAMSDMGVESGLHFEHRRPAEAVLTPSSPQINTLGVVFEIDHHPGFLLRELILPLWILLGIAAILPSIWLYPICTGSRRRKLGLCPRCGYDVRATPDRCSECGLRLAETPFSPR